MVVPTDLIRPAIEVPEIVEVSGQDPTVKIHVRTELRNTSDHDVVLHAPSKAEEVFLHVFDQSRREIARVHGGKESAAPLGAEDFRSVTIAAGHSAHETETIELPASKLKHGRQYAVRGEIFGQTAEAAFTVVAPPPKGEARTKPAKSGGSAKRKTGKKR